MSRIEQLIDEIEEFIESCKPQPFSQSKVIVPKDELYELLTELRLKTPEEIKRYQKIIANRDKIISDAQAQAEKMVEETTAYTNSLVEEHEIMLKAYERAEEVMNNANAQAEATINAANEDAEGIRRSALEYTQELIKNLETIVGRTLEGAKANSQALIDGLSYNYDILVSNKDALESQLSAPVSSEAVPSVDMSAVEESAITEPVYEEPEQEERPSSRAAAASKSEPVVDDDDDDFSDDEFDYDDID